MKAVIVGNGDVLPSASWKSFLADFDLIVAADGGAKFLHKLSVLPQALLGDFDSIPPFLLKEYAEQGVEMERFPREKDYTDTWLAIDFCLHQGAKEITLLNVTGSRLDHTLGAVYLLKRIQRGGAEGLILDDENEIRLLEGFNQFHGMVGTYVSLLPHGGSAVVSSQGLKWNLCDTTMTYDNPIGISNEFLEEKIEIQVKKGQLLMIKNRTSPASME